MSDAPIPLPAAPEAELEEARIFLVNGMSFGVKLPVEQRAFLNWINTIRADGMIAPHPDLTIPLSAVACIVKGAVLQALSVGMPMTQVPASGRLN